MVDFHTKFIKIEQTKFGLILILYITKSHLDSSVGTWFQYLLSSMPVILKLFEEMNRQTCALHLSSQTSYNHHKGTNQTCQCNDERKKKWKQDKKKKSWKNEKKKNPKLINKKLIFI